jgi:hypothetical protein
MELEKFECPQCGAGDYETLTDNKIKCSYCGTVFKVKDEPARKPKVTIKKGANVIFGGKSNVTIKGGVSIEEIANISFLGKLEIVEKDDEEKIKNSIYKKN